MMFPHESPRAEEFGRSPGNGMTVANLSREPLATEGEATPGPDDWNPYTDPPEQEPPEADRLRETHPFFQSRDTTGTDREAEGADGDYQPSPPPLFRGKDDPFRQDSNSGFLDGDNDPFPSLNF